MRHGCSGRRPQACGHDNGGGQLGGRSKAISVAHLEAQLEAFNAQSHELQKLCADIDDDLTSDSESAALSETGVRQAKEGR